MKRLVEFRKIETKDQLFQWAEVVRTYVGGSTAEWADLQDVYAKSDIKVLHEMIVPLKGQEREVVFFAIWKCSGEYAFTVAVNDWIQYRMKREENRYFSEEIQPLLDSIEQREYALEKAKKHIYKKIADLRTEKARLQSRVDYLTEELRDASRRAADRRVQLIKLRNVTEAIKTIQEFVGNGSSEF